MDVVPLELSFACILGRRPDVLLRSCTSVWFVCQFVTLICFVTFYTFWLGMADVA